MKTLLFILCLPLLAQSGWQDMGSSTILHNATKGGVTVVDCPGASYCSGNTATYQFHSLDYQVFDAYSGAAADQINNKLYIWGGGHTDYVGNQVYVLDPVAKTLTRLTDPSGPVNTTGETNPDGTAISRHTNQGLVWLPNESRMFAWGYGVGSAPSPSTNAWWFDPTLSTGTNGWTEKGSLPDTGNDTGNNCILDTSQTTEAVLCVDYNSSYFLFRYTPASDTWVTLGSGPYPIIAGTCAINPHTNSTGAIPGPALVCVGANQGFGAASGIYMVSLASGSPYTGSAITSSTSGCSALYGQVNPGFVWDESLGLFVGFTGAGGPGSNSIITLDPLSGICQTITPSGGPNANHGVHGLYGRFAYFPKLNEYVALTDSAADTYSISLHPASLGHSSVTSSGPCLDVDGDGYGVGAGCSGPDADDSDATVHTAAQVISKYGSIQAYLEHLGYQNANALSAVWCVDPVGGNDGTGASNTNADTACSHAFQHWSATAATSPYIIIFRAGTGAGSQFTINAPNGGTQSAQNVFMSYPGEQFTLDASGTSSTGIYLLGVAYITVDGIKIKGSGSGAGYLSGTYLLYPSTGITAIGNVLKHAEIYNAANDSNVNGNNNTLFAMEECVIHDPGVSGGQHNFYMGNDTPNPSNVAVRRNILYSDLASPTGPYPNLQFNGLCSACYFEQNLLYSTLQQQISFEQGLQNSFVRNNLALNEGSANGNPETFVFSNYDSGQCRVSMMASICSWPQTGNVIENNTFWAGTQGIDGSGTLVPAETVLIANSTTSSTLCGNGSMGPCAGATANIWRNNIIVDLSGTSSVGDTPIYYAASYLSTDTWTDNIIQNSAGSSTIVASVVGGSALTCSAFSAAAASGSGCSTSNPSFTAALTSYYNSPQSFNFSLQSGSPALGAGSTLASPVLDIFGVVRPSPPALGAQEQGPASGESIISGDIGIGANVSVQ